MINKEKIVNLVGMLVIPFALFAASPFWNSMFSEKKNLSYQILNTYHLRENDVTAPTKDWPRMKLIYKNNSIPEATVITVSLTNTGDLPIKSDDFEGKLVFETDNTEDLLEYAENKVFPDNLSPKLKIVGNTLELQPLLLNPADTIIFDIFGRNNFKIKKVNARISGIDSISEYKPEKYNGVMIVNEKEKDSGATLKKELIKLPIVVLAFLTLIFHIMFLVMVSLYAVTKRLYYKSVFIVLGLSSLTIVIIGYHLLLTAINNIGFTFYHSLYLLIPISSVLVPHGLKPLIVDIASPSRKY